MKTAVVILNWNTKGYLEKFVPGILHSLEGTDAELVVADSASTDGSMEMMAEKFPEVRRITLDKNYGFTGGYNRALSMIEAEYYVLINSDIEVQDGWIQPLTETLDRNHEVGACAPKLHSWYERDMFEYAGAAGGYLDSFGFPLCRGRIMNMVEKDEGQYDSPADVFWATGACLMIRSSLFRELGGLDDRFFAHMEEIDLCWRLQLNGYRIRIVPQSTVYHLGGGTLPQTSPWKLKLNYRNNLLMLENNLARTIALQGLSDKVNAEATPEVSLIAGQIDSLYAAQQENSYIGQLGRLVSPAMEPLGFNWKMDVGLLTGIAAKELVVSTLGVMYADGAKVSEGQDLSEDTQLQSALLKDISPAAALSYMVFILLYFPCIATFVAIKNETGKWRWAIACCVYTMIVAWLMAFFVYHLAMLF